MAEVTGTRTRSDPCRGATRSVRPSRRRVVASSRRRADAAWERGYTSEGVHRAVRELASPALAAEAMGVRARESALPGPSPSADS
jgi:hypothetical protein